MKRIKNCIKIKIFKKGAMFGLDARIALAIFSALTVISGVAIYSILEHIKVVKVSLTMEAMAKAATQYMLDTGQDLPRSSDSPTTVYTTAFFENLDNLQGWKGPYLEGMRVSDNIFAQKSRMCSPFACEWGMLKLIGEPGAIGRDAYNYPCVKGKSCRYVSFIHAKSLPIPDSEASQLAFIQALDEYIDGGDGFDNGNLRTTDYSYAIYYLGPEFLSDVM